MAHPKRKTSSSRRDTRRSQWKVSVPSTTQCPQCAKYVMPHRVCIHCGFYRGRQVVVIPEPKPKKNARPN